MKKIKVGIIGLGYVGLTLAIALAKKKIQVTGIEKNQKIFDKLKKFEAHFYEENINNELSKQIKSGNLKLSNKIYDIKDLDVIFVSIGTPINNKKKTQIKNLYQVIDDIIKFIKNDGIIVLRCTVGLNTNNVIKKIIEKQKKKIHLAASPERTVEGSALKELNQIPAIIATENRYVKKTLKSIFQKITKKIIFLKDPTEVEFLKLIDNTWRDVNFAYSNELSKIADYKGINLINIINKISINYPRSKIPMPGTVGGPCLSKDSHILINSVKKKSILPIILNSRKLNEKLPLEIIEKLKTKLSKRKNIKILILGLAFKGKPETSDIRGSMAKSIIDKIYKIFQNPKVFSLDNFVKNEDVKLVNDKIIFFKDFTKIKNKFDLILILNNNKYWKKIGFLKIKHKVKSPNSIIYDFWNNFSRLDDEQYISLGSGKLDKL